MKTRILVLTLISLLAGSAYLLAQVMSSIQSATPVQAITAYYATIPISATAAVNTQTTLTIPAPAPGLYNYVCRLEFVASQDGTSAANSNLTTSSTNFNSFAMKYSLAATANLTYTGPVYQWGDPATGCAKSTSPGVATTFVSPTAVANTAFTWYATYYQAP